MGGGVVNLLIDDVETWGPRDFVNYLKAKLEERDIEYEVVVPRDYITIGYVLKQAREGGKSKGYVKMKIDQIFKDYEFTTVASFNFLRALFRARKDTSKKKYMTPLKDTEVRISSKTTEKLKKLKEDLKEEKNG